MTIFKKFMNLRMSALLFAMSIVLILNPLNARAQDSPELDGKKINVLFIGNSSTYTNDIPALVGKLCTAANHNVHVASVTSGGAKLSAFANTANEKNAEVISTLSSMHWDYVVLQDHRDSVIPNPAGSITAISTLLPHINASGAKLILYGQQADYIDRQYKINSTPVILSHEEAQMFLTQNYFYIANKFNAPLSVCGVNYTRTMALFPDIVLYNLNDNIHPSIAGSYLSACTLYKTIIGETAYGNPFLPESEFDSSNSLKGLSVENAIRLQKVADAGISLNHYNINIHKGNSATLTGSFSSSPDNDTLSGFTNKVEYFSTDTSKAVVNRTTGRISAISTGEVMVMATTDSGLMAFCSIDIDQPCTSLSVDQDATLYLNLKDTVQFKATMLPKDTTDELKWTTSNSSIVTVDSNGKITAKKAGAASVTATTTSGLKVVKKIRVKLATPTKFKSSIVRIKSNKKKVNVSLTWKKVANATRYSIFRSTKKGSGYKKIGESKSGTYIDKKVASGKTFYYKVRALHTNTSCHSAKTTQIKVNTK